MCFKDIVITTVVCRLTRSFTVAVGVEVAGAQPLVVVLLGVQLHAYHGSLFVFLFMFRFRFRQGARFVRNAMPENPVKHVFVLSGFQEPNDQ
jgi:hypothetical protein